jgi:hypothetical protein
MYSTLHVVPALNASGDGGSYLLSIAETRGPGGAALSSMFADQHMGMIPIDRVGVDYHLLATRDFA